METAKPVETVTRPNTGVDGLGAFLHQTMDAKVWAEEFMRIFGSRLNDIDADLMLTWFANAIMCGWDHRAQRAKTLHPFWKLMEKDERTDTEKALIQAVIALSTREGYTHLTPEGVYEAVLYDVNVPPSKSEVIANG